MPPTTQDLRTTRNGLALITLGFLLAPAPYLYFAGGAVGIIGAILLAKRSHGFGSKHSELVMSSVVFYSLGTVIGMGNLYFLLVVTFNSTALLSAFTPGIGLFLVTSILTSILTGLAIVRFTYAFQDSLGKSLLWVGYAATLSAAVVTLIIGTNQLDTILACSPYLGCHPPSTSSLLSLEPLLLMLGTLGFIPAAINLCAYYRGWSKLKRSNPSGGRGSDSQT